MSLTLKVNGESVAVGVPSEMPVLWVLSDILDLKGTKFGCGIIADVITVQAASSEPQALIPRFSSPSRR